jgi:cytochrome c556
MFSTLTVAEENPAIAYRESLMTLVGANFGPMVAMLKGEIPWDDARMAGYGKDLKAVVGLDIMRGFPPGSAEGDTEAKPGIWENPEDFKEKLEAMQMQATKLGELAAGGDRTATGDQIAATGKTCKACHDEYKKKDD